MPPNSIQTPRDKLAKNGVGHQEVVDPLLKYCGIPTPYFFAAASALCIAVYDWGPRWLLSGTPGLIFAHLLGASYGYRVLPFVPVWTFITSVNVAYMIAATSWLFYWLFVVACYPAIFLVCLFQFDAVADIVRRRLRLVLNELQFTADKIALFDIPALEIDTEVDGLMVVRGLTISLSTLTAVAHGIEVGIKLSDDMEMALVCDTVTISLFRRVEIGDVYGQIKGGKYEMTFGNLAENTKNVNGDALMVTDTPLLQAAAANGDTTRPDHVKMTDKMTAGVGTTDSSAKEGANTMTQINPESKEAQQKYDSMLKYIYRTSVIQEAKRKILKIVNEDDWNEDDKSFDASDAKDMRAQVSAHLHEKPTVPHPPKRSIKVTTLQNFSSPQVRKFLHRLPMLYRALLNPIAYFHPVYIKSITAGGSGKWLQSMLQEKIFKEYTSSDAELRRLEARISEWLSEANFVLELADFTGVAQVPFVTAFDIICFMTFGDVMAYRTLPAEVDLKQVVRLGGADANVTVPTFLLPHHEHLLPPKPSEAEKNKKRREIQQADGKPATMQAKHDLEQQVKDETNVKVSAHIRLPACFDQELLDWVSALVKATKVVEFDKTPSTMDHIKEGHSLKDFGKALHIGVKEHSKKIALDALANDKWIAKLVGKVTKQLETAMGDIGYSGDIPVALGVYRDKAEKPSKLLA